MGFKHFNLKDARVNILSAQPPRKKSIDRRKFFKTMGIGALALTPVVGSLKKVLGSPFDLKVTKTGFNVLRNGTSAWRFPAAVFEKGTVPVITEYENSYFIECRDVRFTGSQQAFDILAKIYHNDFSWRMKMEIPQFSLSHDVDFLQFLDNNDFIESKADINYCCGKPESACSMMINGKVDMAIDSRWNFSVKGNDAVHYTYNGETYPSSGLVISSNGRKTQRNYLTAPTGALMLTMPDFKSWQAFVHNFEFSNDYKLTAFGFQPDLNLLLWNDKTGNTRQSVFVNSGQGGLTFSNNRFDNFNFKLHRFFLISETLNRDPAQTYLAAGIHQDGQWYSNPLGSFLMGSKSDIPDFEAMGEAVTFSTYRFAPHITSFKPHIAQAVTLASPFAEPLRLKIVSESKTSSPDLLPPLMLSAVPDTNIKRRTFTRPVNINPPAEPEKPPTRVIKIEPEKKNEIQKTEPVREQQKTDENKKVIAPGNATKREATKQPALEINKGFVNLNPQALKFRLLRPEDMLLLDFEFQNFVFSNQGAETTVKLVENQKNGIITIWFQTQHTLEEAFFESTNIKDNENPSNKGTEIKLPVRHLRAHRSRLVFEYKAGSPGFLLNVDQLLDWSKFDLRTHPRAWIKLPARIDIDRNSRTRTVGVLNRKSNVPLQKANTQYTLKIAQNTRRVSDKLLIYDENKLTQVIDTDLVASLKPDFKANTIYQYLNQVEQIPQDSTSIEAPALMYISPNQLGGFVHKIAANLKPVIQKTTGEVRMRSADMFSGVKSEISELWHTKLGVKLKDGQISDDLPALTSIRALWAHDANTDYMIMPPRNWPFMASLDANNRHKLVHTTSNYNIDDPNTRNKYSPKSVPVNRLMLSSLGAYLDWHAFFDVPTGPDTYLNIIEWQHFATLGRDHFVKIVEEGYLFPFGHRAAIVKITERKFYEPKKAAINRQRMFIVVLEKEVIYNAYSPENKFITFPFQSVTIETSSTPNIEDPQESTINNFPPEPQKNDPKKSANDVKKTNTSYNFYIRVDGKPFNFDIVTTDKDGNRQKIKMPLAFVENIIARNDSYITKIITDYQPKADLNEIGFSGQKIAYAESLLENDTEYETTTLQFGAMVFPSTGNGSIRFHPLMQKAKIYLEQVSQLTGNKEPVEIQVVDDNNKGHVFAKVTSAPKVDFSGGSDKSGGFMSPNMTITALSRLHGPVGGNIDDISNMVFKAADFFKEMGDMKIAKIFGAIDIFSLFGAELGLGDSMKSFVDSLNAARDKIEGYKHDIEILKDKAVKTGENVEAQINKIKDDLKAAAKNMIDTLNNSVPKIPSFKTYVTEDAFHVEYKWQPDLKGADFEIFPNLLSVKIANPQNALSINTHFKKSFDATSSPVLTTEARFDKFSVVVAEMLAVNFNYLKFSGGSSGKSNVNVDLGPGMPLEFIGALDFVNNLQSIIPKTGFSDDGPYIELTTSGIKAGFTISIPNIEVGMCMIANISLGAFVNLPFTGDPMTIGFNFCTRENPFMLTISCFGGGGFFQLITRLDGIQSVEAALEFGAAISLNVGVASGGVSVMGGIYYKSEIKQIEVSPGKIIDQTNAKLSAYIRINGHLSILGLIHVSLEFYLTLDAIIVDGKVQKLEGSATLKVKVEVLFFSKTVSVTVRRTIAGSGGDPKFIEMIDVDDWQKYCLAFAN